MSARKAVASCLLFVSVLVSLTGCLQTSPRLVKIGLVAPFEGRYREIGVDVIPATRLAIREWAAQHPDSDIAIELVAYDDAGDVDQAVAQARKLAADSDVEAVIGHWREDTTAAALPVYDQSALPLIAFTTSDLSADTQIFNLSPDDSSIRNIVNKWAETNAYISEIETSAVTASAEMQSIDTLIGNATWGLSQFYHLAPESTDKRYFASGYAMVEDYNALPNGHTPESFTAAFEEGSLGAPPGLYSVAAYEAAWLALDLVASQNGLENPFSEEYRFDASGRRIDAPIYLYQWISGKRKLIEIFR